ncbi:MAG: dolichyl-phosphate beta-glucosyltransferase [Terriglobales bacterium]
MGPTYSIVIPAFNEELRLAKTLDQVIAFLQQQHCKAEIVVVNDGSTDATADIVRQYARSNSSLKLVENPGNRGKGFAVRNGMLNASGDILLFTDADLSAPITEAPKLVAALQRGADVAIGSRWLDPSLQTQRQSVLRQVLGRVYNVVMRGLLGMQFRDTQCGFKAFTRNAAHVVFPAQTIEGWGFDPEILYLARRSGLRVEEVPVRWGHDTGTRIHPFRDGYQMLLDMVSIRWSAMRGVYVLPERGRAARLAR